MLTTRRYISILCYIAACLICFTQSTPIHAQSISSRISANAPSASTPSALTDYPPDLPSDIEWSSYHPTWEKMTSAFNHARSEENRMLNSAMGPLAFPSAENWGAMSSGERGLWLINEERVARGLLPLHGLEGNVTEVAQAYAELLLASNLFEHDADGRSPWERLDANAAIGACHDFLSIAENIYFQATTGTDSLPFAIEKAIYIMIYADAASQWGHRHAILWTPYTENSGAPDREGFLGIGIAHGGYTSPFDGVFYPSTDMVVMNFFDPCATWHGESIATPTATSSPIPSPTPSSTVEPAPSPSSTPSPTATKPPATPTPTATPTPSGPSGSDFSFFLHLPLILPDD